MGKMAVIWLCVPVIWFGGSTVSELDDAHSVDFVLRSIPSGPVKRPPFLLPPEDFVSPRISLPLEDRVTPREPDVDGFWLDLDYQFR